MTRKEQIDEYFKCPHMTAGEVFLRNALYGVKTERNSGLEELELFKKLVFTFGVEFADKNKLNEGEMT